MRDLLILLVHLITTTARLMGPGGARSVIAESLLIPEITSVDVSGMDKPLATVMGVDDMPRALRDLTQGGARAGRMGPDVAFDESPCGFDGTEVMRVRRQIAQRGAPCLDQASDVGGFVRFEVVEEHDVVRPQAGRQSAADPLDEEPRVDRPPLGVQRDPARPADRADQRQVLPPVHRAWFDVFLAPQDPRVGAPHREVRPRLVEHHQTGRINRPHPSQERGAFRVDVGPVDFARAPAFFLSTYPARRTARTILERLTRPPRGTRRLYARRISSAVASARAAMTAVSVTPWTGECHPPRFGNGVTSPVARVRCTHRRRLLTLIENCSAMATYEPSPASYASTARVRSADG